MTHEFPDNSSILFGREPDLVYLAERCEKPGVTAVLGQPQMGKSWLLLELARRLRTRGWAEQGYVTGALSLKGLPPLVGYTESQGEYADMLPRAVRDLYTRRLEDASLREQARTVLEQQKPNMVGRVGKAVGSLVETIGKSHGPVGSRVGAVVKQMFEGLATLEEDRKSGGMKLPSLQVEDSEELLRIVCDTTGRPAVLIFDQWEKSPDLGKEAKVLDAFLRHLEQWPRCHILVGSRGDREPRTEVKELAVSYPERVESYELGVMRLSETASREALVNS